jgi:hypothetical protein
MDAQLMKVQRELEEATAAIRGLVADLPATAWAQRPATGGWSVAHCVMHLNVTTEEFLPRLDAGIRDGRARSVTGAGPFRRDFVGWMLCKMVEPPYRMKVKTPPKFDPQEVDSREKAMADWDRLQGELYKRIEAADGLALDRVKVVSPFAERMKYNLLAALAVIPAHQRRHIWQAEQILKAIGTT